MRHCERHGDCSVKAEILNWSCVGAWLTTVAFAGGIFPVSRFVKTVLFASTGC